MSAFSAAVRAQPEGVAICYSSKSTQMLSLWAPAGNDVMWHVTDRVKVTVFTDSDRITADMNDVNGLLNY